MKPAGVFSFVVIVSFVLLFLTTINLFAQTDSTAEKSWTTDELLIKYTDGTASLAARAANREIGARLVREFPELGWQLVKLPKDLSVAEAAERYRRISGVALAQPNFVYKLRVTPNDTSYGSLYGITRIDAPTAWNTVTGSDNVVVAVIDTGIRATHEDLAANMWRNPNEIAENNQDDDNNGYVDDVFGYDFFSRDADPSDQYNHGTHCAGTIGAVGNNARGVVGVNWNVRLMALKIYSANGNDSTSAHIIEAFNYVRMMKLRGVNIRVTNNSYSGAPEAPAYDQATKDAIDRAGELDILNVFAAGNDNGDNDQQPEYPASYNSPHIVAVAASTQTDARAGFSAYGATSVDLAAPGVGILSTVNNSNSAYSNFSGTSMAAPHVAGALALLAAANPNLSAASLKASLMNRVDVLPQWNNLVKSGGRLNVARAIANPTTCNFVLSNLVHNVSAVGETNSVNVAAAANCDFSATSQTPWITVAASSSVNSGNATINFTVAPNNGADRIGTIKIADQTFVVNQSGSARASLAVLDFDGNGRTDFSAQQNVNNSLIWFNHNGSNYTVDNFGFFTDDTIPADYDGDGKWDLGVFRRTEVNAPAYFYYLASRTNTFQAAQWGIGSDSPRVTQDFDRDAKADFAVTRRANNYLYWYILLGSGAVRVAQFGLATDVPLRGDFDGDGAADLAVYRPNTGNPANTFFVLKSSDNQLLTANFGVSTTDAVIPADFDGDRKTDFAVWRRTNNVWYWLESSTGAFRAAEFGANGDLPAPGDYDGDGRTDFAVWRPNQNPNESGYFYVLSQTSGFSAFAWGNQGMRIPANALQTEF